VEVGDDEMTSLTPGDFAYARLGRPEIGVVLRALSAGVRLCVGQETVTTTSKTASCSAIGQNGQYRGGAMVTFNNCVLPWGGRLDGTIAIDVSKYLASGQTCGPQAQIYVTHTVTITDLVHVRPTGVRIEYPSLTGTGMSSHAIGVPPASLQLSLTGERKRFQPSGLLVMDHQFQATATVSFTAATATAPFSVAISEMATIQHLLAHFNAAITVNNVVRVPTCCRPISGDIAVVRSGSVNDSHDVSFGPACGQVTLDGSQLNLPECL
jgi:hypothetical protein